MGSLIHRATIRLSIALFLLLWAIPIAAAPVTGQAIWIYDGDTLKVEGIGKVRLLGIDTPERTQSSRDDYYLDNHQISSARLREIAKRALAFNIRHVKGKQVHLDFDQEKFDKFGRTLAYVYLPDGTLLNQLLIEKGLASVYRRFDFRHKKKFLHAEMQAQKNRVGLWQP